MAAACVLAAELDQDEVVVVQETEYTEAGKHPTAQLALARSLGIEITLGPRDLDKPGESIVIPDRWQQLGVTAVNLDQLRCSYLRRAAADNETLAAAELDFTAEDLNTSRQWVEEQLHSIGKEHS